MDDSDTACDFLLDIDPRGAVIRGEGALLASLGLSEGRLRGMAFDRLLAPTDTVLATEILEGLRVAGGRMSARLEFRTAAGDQVDVLAQFRAVTGRAGPLYTRVACSLEESGPPAAAFDGWAIPLDSPESLESVLAEIESELAGATYEDPTLSVFSLAPNDPVADPEVVDTATERMTAVLAVQARDSGRAIRSGERSVSVLHAGDFPRARAEARVAEAVGPDMAASTFEVALAEAGPDPDDRMALVDEVLSASELMDLSAPARRLSPTAARAAINAGVARSVGEEACTREPAVWAADGEPAFLRLRFGNRDASETGRTAAGTRLDARLAENRLARARAMVEQERAQVCLALDADTLMALPAETLAAVGDGVIVRVTGAERAAAARGRAFAAMLGGLPGLMLDGAAVARSPDVQRAVAAIGRLAFIQLSWRLFADAPRERLAAFRDTVALCAGSRVAVYVDNLPDPDAAGPLIGIDALCVSGEAVAAGAIRPA